jgi:Xaa-Pro aminopeptidase
MNYPDRRQVVARALEELTPRLDALIVTYAPNIQYLCGFTGSAGALLAIPPRWMLFTDGRYAQQARLEAPGVRVVISPKNALAAVAEHLNKKPALAAPRDIAFEADHFTVSARSLLGTLLPRRMHLHETTQFVERFRMIKEAEEIERLRAAVLLGAKLLETAMAAIKPGVNEIAVAAEIEYQARRNGADGMSFETIVASGPRSALPHARAQNEPIPRSGFVVLDFGVKLNHYCSDMTRTLHIGQPTREMRSLYEAVLAGQEAAIAAVRPGVNAAQVDAAARRVLRRAGLGRFFSHSTGHGVGLEVHEPPRLGRNSEDVLQAGMVITIEPGAYLAGKGGARIEDMVLVNATGAEVLTPVPKHLQLL